MKRVFGFSLVEILLVVAAAAILVGIVVLAIKPGSKLIDARNTQRGTDVTAILNAVHQYASDNDTLPPTIPAGVCTTATTEICLTGATTCMGLVDLSSLTLNQKYLTSIPTDPLGPTTTNGTGYRVAKSAEGVVSVCAPATEATSTVITSTR